jgi:hypothetical protein
MTEQRDIVERLDNIGCVYAESSGRPDNEASDAVVEAAAEITRLREQLRIAREGLVSVTDYYDTSPSCCDGGYEDGYNTGRYEACKIARELLDRMDQEARDD